MYDLRSVFFRFFHQKFTELIVEYRGKTPELINVSTRISEEGKKVLSSASPARPFVDGGPENPFQNWYWQIAVAQYPELSTLDEQSTERLAAKLNGQMRFLSGYARYIQGQAKRLGIYTRHEMDELNSRFKLSETSACEYILNRIRAKAVTVFAVTLGMFMEGGAAVGGMKFLDDYKK